MQNQIAEAVQNLNPAENAHWTLDGRPNCNVLKEALGRTVSRAMVDQAAPGFTRPALQEAVGEEVGGGVISGGEDGAPPTLNNIPRQASLAECIAMMRKNSAALTTQNS